jgi:hypothetical protein
VEYNEGVRRINLGWVCDKKNVQHRGEHGAMIGVGVESGGGRIGLLEINYYQVMRKSIMLHSSFILSFFFYPGDFGEARSFTTDHTGTMTALGSMLYMAPEILRNERYVFYFLFMGFTFIACYRHSFPCDVWSLGVILYKVRISC